MVVVVVVVVVVVIGLNGGSVTSAGASVVDLALRRLITLRCGGSTGAE